MEEDKTEDERRSAYIPMETGREDTPEGRISRRLAGYDYMVFLEPGAPGDGSNFRGKAKVQDVVLKAGFGYARITGGKRGDRRQVLMLYGHDPSREQALLYYAVSAARGFGQTSVFFVDCTGRGYAADSSGENGRIVGEERFFDGRRDTSSPVRILASDVTGYLSAYFGGDFRLGPDVFRGERYARENGGRRLLSLMERYRFDCADAVGPAMFRTPPACAEGSDGRRVLSFLKHRLTLCLVPLRSAAEADALDRLTDRLLFGHARVADTGDVEERVAVLLFLDRRYEDGELLRYAVSAAAFFGGGDVLYVDSFLRGFVVSSRDGEERPLRADACGRAAEVTEEDVLAYARAFAGDDARVSEGVMKQPTACTGMYAASLREALERLGRGFVERWMREREGL